MRKADAARRRPIEHRGDHRAGLADEGDVAGRRREMREARVEPDAGARSARRSSGRRGAADAGARRRASPAAARGPLRPVRRNPAVITTAALRAARAEFGDEARHRIGRGRRSPRDRAACGRLATSRVDRHAVEVCRCGLTSSNSPSNPARRRLRSTTAPTEPGRSLAPISATLCGRNSFSKLRIDISRVPDYRADAGSAPPGALIPIKQRSGESSQQLTIFSSRMTPNARGICRHCTSLKPDAAPDARSSRRNWQGCRNSHTIGLSGQL